MKECSHIEKKILGAVLFILAAFGMKAQDFHLSQYDANPLYLNPALTGMNADGDWAYRTSINYREQWNKFMPAKPYATVAAGLDVPLGKKFSIGDCVFSNKGAGGLINTFGTMLSGAYKIINNDPENRHNLSVGLQMGLLQKSINVSDFVFDSQYSSSVPDAFDKRLPNGENFRSASVYKFDANMGVYYRLIDKDKKYSPFAGVAVYHLTRPDESFTGVKSKMPMRFVLHGGWYYKVDDKLTILRQVLYMNQANANELNLEGMAFYKMKDDYEPMLGFAWRYKDAVVIHLGLKQKNNIFRISYDINTSYIKQYTNGKGALEFSVIYTGEKKAKTAPKLSSDDENKKPEK